MGAKVMVAVKDAESLEGLVELAGEVAKGMNAALMAVHVVEVPAATPLGADDAVLDRPGHELLERVRSAVTKQFGMNTEVRLVRARDAGEAIVAEMREMDVATLVMGHRRPSYLGEMFLGSTVHYVTHHAPCRVVVQVPPARRK